MKLKIPAIIYTGALVQAHLHLFSVYFLLAIFLVESTFRWDAKGDYGPGDPNRFPGDPFWYPDDRGLYPHSFGLGQLHVDGAGSGHRPAELLDITNNIVWSGKYLSSCLAGFPVYCHTGSINTSAGSFCYLRTHAVARY